MPNGRSWTLEGNIVGGGHIAGVYSADAGFDEGVGSFYLKITGENLEGLWSGYDSVNKTTSSGRYIFNKKTNAAIRDAKPADIPKMLALSTPLFGEGYVSDIRDYANNLRASLMVAEENASIIGFAMGKVFERSEGVKYIGVKTCAPTDVKHSDVEGELGLIKTIGVEHGRQGHGVGELLFRAMEKN